MNNYARLPVTFTSGSGAILRDDQGKDYLDALSGIAVCGLGHAHPAVTDAIKQQAKTLLHVSNLYGIAEQERLGERLCELAGMDRVMFGNSGAEANEAAIKLARLHGHNKGIDVPAVIVCNGAFHGRTMATLSATANPKVREGFAPLVESFIDAPYGDIAAIKTAIATHDNVCAVLVEPVQGEGGVNVPPNGYLKSIRALCDQHDLLFMLDEIQTGIGRTGAWFAWQHEGAKPDVLTSAKALGNGVPIGACMASNQAADLFAPGMHGSTFGGNPLACSAALAVLDTIEENDLVARAKTLGETILNTLAKRLTSNSAIVDIRGKGLMIGIELDRPCGDLVKLALAEGLLINVTAGNVVRLLPPLIFSDAQAKRLVDQLCSLIETFVNAS